MFRYSRIVLKCCLFLMSVGAVTSCRNQETQKPTTDYIRAIPGKSDSIPAATAEQGEVLIAYSDCYTCHKEDQRSIGPAFKDIAKRYPVQERFINMLAYKIVSGGSGAWGNVAMSDHSKVTHDDAKLMVCYILSLK